MQHILLFYLNYINFYTHYFQKTEITDLCKALFTAVSAHQTAQ